MKKLFKKYWILGLAAGVLVGFIVFLPIQKLFRNYTNKILFSALSEMVEDKTQGVYYIQYDDLRYNLFKQKIRLKNFVYFPKDTNNLVIDSLAKQNKYYFGVQVKTLEIEIDRQFDFFFANELTIKRVKIIEPHIKVLNQRIKKEEVSLSKIAGNLYQLVTQYLQTFQLHQLDVQDAKMTYYLNTTAYFKRFDFHPFSFKIKDFRVDKNYTLNNQKNVLFTEDFEFNSGYQSFLMPDSVHKISFDRLLISLKKEVLELNNVKVEPLKSSLKPEQSHVNLFVPDIKLKGVNFEKAYINNEIDVEKLTVERPAMVLKLFANHELKTQQDSTFHLKMDSNLLQAIGKIVVGRAILSRANMQLEYTANKIKRTFDVKGFTYKGSDVELDSNDVVNFSAARLQNNYRFHAYEIRHEIPQEGLEAKVFNLDYSSITKVMDIDGAYFKTNQRKLNKMLRNHEQPVYLQQLEIERIHLTNLPLSKCIDYRKIDLSSARITRPVLTLLYDTAYVSDSLKSTSTNQFTALFDTLIRKKIDINNAHVVLTDPYGLNKKYAEMEELNFYVNRAGKPHKKLDWYQVLEKSALQTGHSFFELPSIPHLASWSRSSYSSAKKSIDFTGLKYSGTSRGIESNVHLKTLEILGFEPKKVLDKKELDVKQIKAGLGRIEIKQTAEDKYGKDNNSLPEFKVDSVALDKIDFLFAVKDSVRQRFEQAIVNLGKVQHVKDSLNRSTYSLYSALAKFKNGFISIDKNRHYLELEHFRLSTTDSLIDLDRIELKPVINSKIQSSNPIMRSSIQHIRVNGFSHFASDLSQSFKANHIEICDPQFRISGVQAELDTNQQGKSLLELHKWFARALGINHIQYQSLQLENGLIDADWLQPDGKKWHLSLPQYSLHVNEFDLRKSSKNSDQNFMYAQNYELIAYQPEQVFPDSLRYLKAQKLTYRTSNKYLKLENASGRFMVYRKGDSSKNIFVEGSAQNIEIEGLKPIELQTDKAIRLERIHLENPDIHITQFHKNSPYVSRELETDREKNDDQALKELFFKNLKLNNGELTWAFDDTSKKGFHFKHVNLNGNEIGISPNKESKPQFGEVELSFGNFRHEVLDKFYTAHLDSFYLNSSAKQMKLWGAGLEPNYGIFEFSKIAGWEKSRLELEINKLELQNFELKKLLYNNRFETGLIWVDSLWVRNFKNKNYPMIDRYMPLPASMLKKLPLTVSVDSLKIKKGHVTHRQLAPNGVKSGKLVFSDLKGTILNITNDSIRTSKNPYMWMKASTKLMEQGEIDASFRFNLADTIDEFIGNASIGKFDATLLNEYVEPTQYVRIRKGIVNGGKVSLIANDSIGTGEMRLLYKNLHVDFLNPKDPEKAKNMGLLMKTFLANRVVNTQNPHFFITKKGDVYSTRDTARAIFHYWGRLAMSGVASSTGVQSNKKEIRKMRKQIDQLQRDALKREKAIRRREEEEEEQLAKKKPKGKK